MATPPTGIPITVDPLVARVLAPNPSPFTFTGTQTHLVGTRDLAIIDPGPDDRRHLGALMTAIDGRPVRAILVTHTHHDHSPAAAPLAAMTGAPVMGAAPLMLDIGDDAMAGRADAAFDESYAPDRVLTECDEVAGEGWTLTTVATPGHTSNHLAFALAESRALFTGDHVMGWSTTVVMPPDGDMAAFMASMEKLRDRDDQIYFPAHGEPIAQPQRYVRHLIGHRRMREAQILGALDMPRDVAALVERIYIGLDPRLRRAAGGSVLAHLLDLEARGAVSREGEAWARG